MTAPQPALQQHMIVYNVSGETYRRTSKRTAWLSQVRAWARGLAPRQ